MGGSVGRTLIFLAYSVFVCVFVRMSVSIIMQKATNTIGSSNATKHNETK